MRLRSNRLSLIIEKLKLALNLQMAIATDRGWEIYARVKGLYRARGEMLHVKG